MAHRTLNIRQRTTLIHNRREINEKSPLTDQFTERKKHRLQHREKAAWRSFAAFVI
jgi:hypothetical protein